jgi:hypothetical protein
LHYNVCRKRIERKIPAVVDNFEKFANIGRQPVANSKASILQLDGIIEFASQVHTKRQRPVEPRSPSVYGSVAFFVDEPELLKGRAERIATGMCRRRGRRL